MIAPARGWLSEEQQAIWRSYLRAKSHVEEYLENTLRPFGISLAEYELLVRLSEAPERTIRMGELAASVGHSRSRLTHTVKRLEQAGWLVRESCDCDGRGVQAVLTDAGFSFLKVVAPHHVDSVRQVFVDAIDAADYQALGRAMEAVLATGTLEP